MVAMLIFSLSTALSVSLRDTTDGSVYRDAVRGMPR